MAETRLAVEKVDGRWVVTKEEPRVAAGCAMATAILKKATKECRDNSRIQMTRNKTERVRQSAEQSTLSTASSTWLSREQYGVFLLIIDPR